MKKGWTIYSFYTGMTDAAEHFPNLREAEKGARAWLDSDESEIDSIDIERNEVVPMTRANFIDVLNTSGGSWSRTTEIVKTLKRRKRA